MQNNFYTYIHRKPNGCIFYVGKGKKQRAYSVHGRNPHWRGIYKKYGSFNVEIVDDNLVESQAFELEEFIISMIGIKSQGGTLVNMTTGGEGASGYVPTPEVCKKNI